MGPPTFLFNLRRAQYLWAQTDHGLNLTTHFHTVQRFTRSGAITPRPSAPSWCNRSNIAYTKIRIRSRPIYSYVNAVSSSTGHVDFHT